MIATATSPRRSTASTRKSNRTPAPNLRKGLPRTAVQLTPLQLELYRRALVTNLTSNTFGHTDLNDDAKAGDVLLYWNKERLNWVKKTLRNDARNKIHGVPQLTLAEAKAERRVLDHIVAALVELDNQTGRPLT